MIIGITSFIVCLILWFKISLYQGKARIVDIFGSEYVSEYRYIREKLK